MSEYTPEQKQHLDSLTHIADKTREKAKRARLKAMLAAEREAYETLYARYEMYMNEYGKMRTRAMEAEAKVKILEDSNHSLNVDILRHQTAIYDELKLIMKHLGIDDQALKRLLESEDFELPQSPKGEE